MTLNELKAKHSDIIQDFTQPVWESLERMANAQVLFFVSVYPGTKTPKADRQVRWAGPVMTVGMNSAKTELLFIRLTTNGNAIVDYVSKEELEENGRAALFQTVAFSANDRRNRKPWNEWQD